MRAALGIVVAGVLVAALGAIGWARAAASRESEQVKVEWERAYGWDTADPSSGGVWFAAAVVGFGALTTLAGTVLAVAKKR